MDEADDGRLCAGCGAAAALELLRVRFKCGGRGRAGSCSADRASAAPLGGIWYARNCAGAAAAGLPGAIRQTMRSAAVARFGWPL